MAEHTRNVQPSEIARKTAQMVDMLPENEQILAYETVKRFVLAWDLDFVNMTDLEARRVDNSEAELARGEFVGHEEIDWS